VARILEARDGVRREIGPRFGSWKCGADSEFLEGGEDFDGGGFGEARSVVSTILNGERAGTGVEHAVSQRGDMRDAPYSQLKNT